MSKHTPGPWKVAGKTELCITDVDDLSMFIGSASIRGNKQTYEKSYEEAKANARLIAAAPELLEALESVINDWLKRADCVLPKETCEKVIIAIAKAKGE